jgi:hypothetical protein
MPTLRRLTSSRFGTGFHTPVVTADVGVTFLVESLPDSPGVGTTLLLPFDPFVRVLPFAETATQAAILDIGSPIKALQLNVMANSGMGG